MFTKEIYPDCYKVMGARLNDRGASFRVWAPHAKRVSLIGHFNQWNETSHILQKTEEGLWELFIEGMGEGECYKFAVEREDGHIKHKNDPFALYCEVRPNSASITARFDQHIWADTAWFSKPKSTAMHIYELHLGAWREGANTYLEITDALIPYIKEMGFTHVEILPITEHPLDESWGYQVSGYYAITSRYGTIQDFQLMIDRLHQADIGVILDWVPGHFPKDAFALAQFDGTALFEYSDPQKGYQPTWDTLVFDYRSIRVRNFLLGSALYFLEAMHIDGLRVDAVYSMLYQDFGRKNWSPNQRGGRENLEAIEFLQLFNQMIHTRVPSAITIAEEAGTFPNVTGPIAEGGLGFDFKWNMGWTHDILELLATKPQHRTHRHGLLNLIASYSFLEKHVLPLSHDEGSIYEKMAGEDIEKWANLRLLFGFFFCFPGKKLTFMGYEIGQKKAWSVKENIAYDLLEKKDHQNFQHYLKAFGHFYQTHPQLWGDDYTPFDSQSETGLFAFWRADLLCAFAFKTQSVTLNIDGNFKEVFRSDAQEYGGFGNVDSDSKTLAPLSMRILKHE